MEVLISLAVTQFLLCARGKGSRGPLQEGLRGAVMAAVGGRPRASLAAGTAGSRPPGCSRCCRFSAEHRVSQLWIQSISEVFSYFCIFLWKLDIFASSEGLKCLLCCFFFFSFQRFSGTKKCFLCSSRCYRAEVREQSSAPSWEKNIVPNIFL